MKRFIGTLAAIIIILGGAGTASAKVQYPSAGGVWNYGNGKFIAYSYYTVNRCHGSSIKEGKTVRARSVNTGSGKKSIAEHKHYPWSSGYSYHYRVC